MVSQLVNKVLKWVNSGDVRQFHHDLEENTISSKGVTTENLNIVWFQTLVKI